MERNLRMDICSATWKDCWKQQVKSCAESLRFPAGQHRRHKPLDSANTTLRFVVIISTHGRAW